MNETKNLIIIITLIYQYILFTLPIYADNQSSLNTVKCTFRSTYEVLTLPEKEKMGLMSFNYLVDFNPWFYSGIGVYSAEYGQRGGFFTGGIDFGFNVNIFNPFRLNSGFFIGGGGGGAAPQGGGLMLRPYAGILYDTGVIAAGAGLSRAIFPNGEIDSTQVYMQIAIPFSILLTEEYNGDIIPITDVDLMDKIFQKQIFLAVYETYFPAKSTITTQKNKASGMGLAGIVWSVDYYRSFFILFQAAGAMKGDSDGYAELFTGAGARFYIAEGLGLKVNASVGGAGGGRVDTGGGFIYKMSTGGFYSSADGLMISLEGVYLNAPSGSFSGTGIVFGIGSEFDVLSDNQDKSGQIENSMLKPGRWRVRLGNKCYLPSDNMRKDSAGDNQVDLMTFKIDRFISNNMFITGHAVGAYAGGAGGYAEGLFGAGLITPAIFYGASVFTEIAAGAAGGGGIATDGGFIIHPIAGVSWLFYKDLSVEISAGVIKALKGRLFSPVIEAGMGYRFSFIERKDLH